MQKLRCSTALVSQAMKLATQTLLHEQPLLAFGSRRSLFHGNGKLLFARTKNSYGFSTATYRPAASLTEAAPRIARFAAGRLSFCSQLLPTEGGRKVSTGAAAVCSVSDLLQPRGRPGMGRLLFCFTC